MDPLTTWTMIVLAVALAGTLFAAGRQSATRTSRSEPPPNTGSDLEPAIADALRIAGRTSAPRPTLSLVRGGTR